MSSRAAVLATLRVFPRGRSVAQILDHLGRCGSREAAAAVNRELHHLAGDGLVTVAEGGLWQLTSWQQGERKTETSPSLDAGFLHGVPAVARRSPRSEDVEPCGGAAMPDPAALIRYYRSALRSDPRGASTEVADRHGTTWQVIACSGPWWPGSTESSIVAMRLTDLPDTIRQALARRSGEETALALGWPLAVGQRDGVPVVRPIGLLSASWQIEADQLRLLLEDPCPVINPEWLSAESRTIRWPAGRLREFLEAPDDADAEICAFGRRLKEAAASQVRGTLDPLRLAAGLDAGRIGISDALALFLPTDQTFTAGAVSDLDRIATWPGATLADTALGALLGARDTPDHAARPALHATPLNSEQIEAVGRSTSTRLGVVTGPPGTGKTQTILGMIATALAEGQRVLVASRNHQALDAVEERLGDLLGDRAAIVRTLDPEEGRDVGLREVLRGIVAGEDGGSQSAAEPMANARQLAERRDRALAALTERRRLQLVVAEALDLQPAPQEPLHAPSPTWWHRLLNRLKRTDRGRSLGSETERRLAALADARARLAELATPSDDPVVLSEQVAAATRDGLARLVPSRLRPSDAERRALSDALSDIALHGQAEAAMAALAPRVLACRPVWLSSVLGTPRRLPLVPGLFDLVIFDEASQCDIGSALPLLARARRAVVVGDDRQLSMIPALGPAQDRNLMAAHGLPNQGMGRWAQSLNSLFGLAQSTPGASRILLRDQFRSAAGITDYISEAFYGGRLRVAVDEARLKAVPNRRPGLHWTDVPGTARSRPDGGTGNPAEAKAIADHLVELLIAQGFDGTVGVVTPFNAQIAEIRQAIGARLPDEVATRVQLRIATVDRFQGQERDLMIVSPVLCALSPPSARNFVARDWRRINVAVSRARSVAHVMGDLSFARTGGIDSLQRLAARATQVQRPGGEDRFDSEWERILFHAMRARGWQPIPQHPVAGRRLDFALQRRSGGWLDVEVDGRQWHQDIDGNRKVDDLWRDARLKALGWRVRRFWVDELNRNLEGCLDVIADDLA